jgi:hypothetical protein
MKEKETGSEEMEGEGVERETRTIITPPLPILSYNMRLTQGV